MSETENPSVSDDESAPTPQPTSEKPELATLIYGVTSALSFSWLSYLQISNSWDAGWSASWSESVVLGFTLLLALGGVLMTYEYFRPGHSLLSAVDTGTVTYPESDGLREAVDRLVVLAEEQSIEQETPPEPGDTKSLDERVIVVKERLKEVTTERDALQDAVSKAIDLSGVRISDGPDGCDLHRLHGGIAATAASCLVGQTHGVAGQIPAALCSLAAGTHAARTASAVWSSGIQRR